MLIIKLTYLFTVVGGKVFVSLHVNSIETYIFFSFNFEVGFSFWPHNNFVNDFKPTFIFT